MTERPDINPYDAMSALVAIHNTDALMIAIGNVITRHLAQRPCPACRQRIADTFTVRASDWLAQADQIQVTATRNTYCADHNGGR